MSEPEDERMTCPDCTDDAKIVRLEAHVAELEAESNTLQVALKVALQGNSQYREVLEKCGEAFEFLARYYFPDGTEARDLVKQALQPLMSISTHLSPSLNARK